MDDSVRELLKKISRECQKRCKSWSECGKCPYVDTYDDDCIFQAHPSSWEDILNEADMDGGAK